MKQKPEVIANWIRQVNEEATKPLSKWEEDFMMNVTDAFEREGSISEGREEKLEQIYVRVTS